MARKSNDKTNNSEVERKTRRENFRIKPSIGEKLDELTIRKGMSKNEIIEQAISQFYNLTMYL